MSCNVVDWFAESVPNPSPASVGSPVPSDCLVVEADGAAHRVLPKNGVSIVGEGSSGRPTHTGYCPNPLSHYFPEFVDVCAYTVRHNIPVF